MTTKKTVVKRAKKVNVKDLAKAEIMEIIEQALAEKGITFSDGTDYDMTKGTIIAHHEKADVQIKPISPKAGLERYQKVEIVYED